MNQRKRAPRHLKVDRQTPAEPREVGGLRWILQNIRAILGADVRILPPLVALMFLMGLAEAGLVLLVVQMAVALAAGDDRFDLHVGPFSINDIDLIAGCGMGVGLVVLLLAGLIPVALCSGRLAARSQHRARARLLHAYLNATWAARAEHPEGHLQELLTTYTRRTELAITQLITAGVAFCGLVTLICTAVASAPLVAVAAVFSVGGLGGALRPLILRTRAASRRYGDVDHDFAGRMAEISRITPEIAAFDVAESVEQAVEPLSLGVRQSLQRLRTLSRLSGSLYQYLALLLIVLAIAALSRMADGEQLATIGAALLLMVRALSYAQSFQAIVQAENENAPFLEVIEETIATLSEAERARGGVLVDAPVPLVFDDVHFAYPSGADVLQGVSFGIRSGEALGVVGRSGAGKSTLVQLLLRLRAPTSGAVTVDGVPLDRISLDRWYELVSYVPQDNQLLSGTITENIRFFRDAISDEAVRDAARRAHLDAEILQLPQGFETLIGPGVRDLSGGQRQRLGIARALAGDPRLIILDEPTSALDSRSEQLVAQTLAELRGAVTLVIVAHRPATTDICDRVIRIEGGRAVDVERGMTAATTSDHRS